MPKTAEKSQCGRSICPGPFFLKIRHFKDISHQLCLVHFMTLCSYKHRCSKMTTFMVCIAEALDSLLIKTHPGKVLMLFLTSCTPVPVVLSKTIIQNVFRSCLTKSLASIRCSCSLLSLGSSSKHSFATPPMCGFYQASKTIPLLGFPAHHASL